MNVGYHHHVPSVFADDGGVYVPGHFGMFTDELARQAGSVVYYTYETQPTGIEDHALSAGVRCVNLGPRPRAPIALLSSRRVLRRVDLHRDGVDALLVRGPGPLLPSLIGASGDIPSAVLIVGDYRSWSPNAANPGWRNQLIRAFRFLYGRLQSRAVRDVLVMTQNPWLLEHGSGSPFRHGHVVFTSSTAQQTVDAIDQRSSGGNHTGGRIRLLYTGRIVEEKGVLLIVEALALLVSRGFDVELALVGWAPDSDPTPGQVSAIAAQRGVQDRIAMPGFATAAEALVERYLTADVFVFASPTEWGSSHTIPEAMVARVPVVTSSFEGIRGELRDGEHAVIVEPGSARALADGIERLLRDDDLRAHLVENGRRWAEGRTNERSVELVLRHLTDWMERHRVRERT
jgi:glycosyltransferase involved in cell wall biosynthesis